VIIYVNFEELPTLNKVLLALLFFFERLKC